MNVQQPQRATLTPNAQTSQQPFRSNANVTKAMKEMDLPVPELSQKHQKFKLKLRNVRSFKSSFFIYHPGNIIETIETEHQAKETFFGTSFCYAIVQKFLTEMLF